MRHVVLGLAALTIVCPGIAEARADPISKVEARSLPTGVLTRRILNQLSDILVETTRPKGKRPPSRPLQDITFWTRVRPSRVASLCEADLVWVNFGPPSNPQDGPEALVRAQGVRASTYYHLTTLPLSVSGDDFLAPGDDPAGCAKLSAERLPFFKAADEQLALGGMQRLGAVLGQGKTERHPFGLICEPPGRASKFCDEPLTGLSPAKVTSIDYCRPDKDSEGAACWAITFFDVVLTIQGDFGDAIKIARGSGPPEIATPRITRVQIEQQLLLIHERVD